MNLWTATGRSIQALPLCIPLDITGGIRSVKIESDGKTAFYLGDMIPTAAHVPLPYIMGYDLYPPGASGGKEKDFKRRPGRPLAYDI